MDTLNIYTRHAFQLVFEGKVYNLKMGETYTLPKDVAQRIIDHNGNTQGNERAVLAQPDWRPADLSACYDDDATRKLPKIANPRSRPVNPYLDAAYQRPAGSVPSTGGGTTSG